MNLVLHVKKLVETYICIFLIDQPVSINKIIYTEVLAFRDFELRVPAITVDPVSSGQHKINRQQHNST